MLTATEARTFEDSTDLLENPVALRERADSDGYLFFRGLLPTDAIRQVRHDILSVCQKYGWIKQGTNLEDGLCDLDAVNRIPAEQVTGGAGIPFDAYNDIMRLESFHRIALHPNLLSMYGSLFGQRVFAHPRNIARVIVPHDALVPTPSHQDYVHVQGATNTWTCWFPLGDLPRKMGGLSVLRKSHQDGVRHLKPALGAGGQESQICSTETDWLEIDYLAGDVLTFPSLTVHKAIPQKVRDRIRLSCDFRYQPADQLIDKSSLDVHFGQLTWEDVYKGWKHDDLKYYWRGNEPGIKPWDEAIRWQKERIC